MIQQNKDKEQEEKIKMRKEFLARKINADVNIEKY